MNNNDTDTQHMDSKRFADVEIYIRPASAKGKTDDEYVFELSYKDMAEYSTHSLSTLLPDLYKIDDPGRYEIGIRQEGDRQYWQRFEVVSPHVSEQGKSLIENHAHGVLNHWRA